MNEKLFNALKQAFPQLGLSDEFLKSFASTFTIADDADVEAIAKQQEPLLKLVQAANDKRATDAAAKARKAAVDEARAAQEKAVAEALARQAEQKVESKKEVETPKNEGEPDWLTAFRKELADKERANTKKAADMQKQFSELLERSKVQNETLESLKAENEQMKADKAKADRAAYINGTAAELGIPDWRVKEGFALPADADKEAVKTYLSTVASNIKTAGLQTGGGKLLNLDDKPSKDDIDAIADKLLQNI